MPRIADYSTTVIYKITCNDPNIIDKYVGHTTDLVRRRQEHKTNTCNENSPYHNIKLYKFIRDNGGWDNWKMEVVTFYNCGNLIEARQKEQEHYIELNASLNSMEPLTTKQIIADEAGSRIDIPLTENKFFCEKCKYGCRDSSNWSKHILTYKHLDNKPKKSIPLIVCESCNFQCYKQSRFDIHKRTNKHKMKEAENKRVEPPNDSDIMFVVKQLLHQNNELKDFIIKQADDHKHEIINIMNKAIENVKLSLT